MTEAHPTGPKRSDILFQGRWVRLQRLPGNVVKLVLARPEVRNAFHGGMIREMLEATSRAVELSPPARVLLVEGDGDVFCAGADIAYMKEQSVRTEGENVDEARVMGGMFHALASFPSPVVAAVRGAALGGGMGLVACADYVLAEDDALMATSEVRLGIVPGVIGPFLVRKLGPAHAGPLMLSGRRCRARELVRCGLVHETAPKEAFWGALARVLDEFCAAGPEAARRCKALVLALSPLPDSAAMDAAARAIASARASAEGVEGLAAFLEKRQPSWTITGGGTT